MRPHVQCIHPVLYLCDAGTQQNIAMTKEGQRVKGKRAKGIPIQDIREVNHGAKAGRFRTSSNFNKHVRGQESKCMTVVGKDPDQQFFIKIH